LPREDGNLAQCTGSDARNRSYLLVRPFCQLVEWQVQRDTSIQPLRVDFRENHDKQEIRR